MRWILSSVMLGMVACGDDSAPECKTTTDADFARQSGWEAASYAPTPTALGCYPYKVSEAETFGSFITMRTSATGEAEIAACKTTINALNCGTYRGAAGELTFNVKSADRLSMSVSGTLNGRHVGGVWYFNPCQPSCLAAITLTTVEPMQQTLCEIPSQVTQCLFPEDAQSITFARAGADSFELRLAGQSYTFDRIE